MHFRHRWVVVEVIGRVVTERCGVCGKTRTRVRGPVSDSPAAGSRGTGHALKGAQRGSETHREWFPWMLCRTEQRHPRAVTASHPRPNHRNEDA